MSQVLHIVRAYWKHSLITFLSVTALCAIGIKLLPKMYVATATLIVNHAEKDPLAGREALNGLELQTYIPTQIELITSRAVLNPVVDKLDLLTDKGLVRGVKGPPAVLRESVLHNLSGSLQVAQGLGSNLVYISASHENPVLAAKIANAVANEYLEQERQRANKPAHAKVAVYAADLAELRAKVEAAQERVIEFREQHDMPQIEADKGDVDATALADLQQKLLAAQNQRRELEARQIDSQASSDQALDSRAVQDLRARLASEQQQMAELLATLGPRHPKVIQLQSETAATQKSLAAEMQSISNSAHSALDRARELERSYQRAVDAQQHKAVDRRSLQDQASKLLVELDSARTTYKRALDGYDQAVFASAADNADVSLVSSADPPVKSEKPKKAKLFLGAIAAALALALGWPFTYEMLVNRRLRCRDDLERSFGIAVLAQLGSTAGSRA
jgi:uncharacterized protein involved in exopolysaccharide biosynthesis